MGKGGEARTEWGPVERHVRTENLFSMTGQYVYINYLSIYAILGTYTGCY